MVAKVVAGGRSRPALWRSMEKSRPVALNGDSYLVEPMRPLPGLAGTSAWLFAVADGLGGEGHDDLASQTAVNTLRDVFRGEQPLQEAVFEQPNLWLAAAYETVNRVVCEERRARRLTGMYTTLTTALLVSGDDGLCLYPGNVGDSRMYLQRDRRLTQLTRDDGEGGFISRVIGDPNVFNEPFLRYATTVARTDAIETQVQEELEQALRVLVSDIEPEDARPLASLFLTLLEGMCPVDLAPAYSRPLAILYEGLGPTRFRALINSLAQTYQSAASRLAPIPLQAGDRILLCSDGISNAFNAAFLQEVLGMSEADHPPEQILENILTWLLETPGRIDDDRTGVVIQVESTG